MRTEKKHAATRLPVTQVDMRAVEADLAPSIDTVNGSRTISDSDKAYTLVKVCSRIVDVNENGNLVLTTVVQ